MGALGKMWVPMTQNPHDFETCGQELAWNGKFWFWAFEKNCQTVVWLLLVNAKISSTTGGSVILCQNSVSKWCFSAYLIWKFR